MTLVSPAEREFAVMEAGFIRDQVVLANFRAGLRTRVNPRTGTLFTEDEILAATRPGSRWYREAQAIDDYGQGRQKNALYMNDQIRADRASDKWLEDYHAAPLGLKKLKPTGGSGTVRVTGADGTLVVGSTTMGAPGVHTARDPIGNFYQVILGGEVGVTTAGQVDVTIKAVSTGKTTNPIAGTVLTWVTSDPGINPQAVVLTDFRGGTNIETSAELLSRVVSVKRYKPAAGNDAQMNAWARASSNAILEGFVYSTAFHAGTVMIALTAKRGETTAPDAQVVPAATLLDARTYLTPPQSPVVPRAYGTVVVVTINPEPSDLVMKLALKRGTAAGWADSLPFPSYHATTPIITSLTSQLDFQVTCPGNATLPGQVALATMNAPDVPGMMFWNVSTSSFEALNVSSIEDFGSNVFRVVLSGAPSATLAVGQVVCPLMQRHAYVSEAARDYFDALGPGELFDLTTDVRGGRCVRFPETSDVYPFRVGGAIATRVIEALGISNADAVLDSATLSEPTYPTDLLQGPNKLTLGKLGVYAI